MIQRQAEKKIHTLFKQFPVVLIGGARQIGKSTIALQIYKKKAPRALYFDLELPSDRNKLYDPETLFKSNTDKLIIIDEAQTMPELFNILRPVVDKYKKNGKYMLLGSVSPFLIKNVSQTLAGRVGYIEISGINISEATSISIDYKKLWFRGGFPKALLLRSNSQWYYWMENYERTFVERDVTWLMNESISPFTVRKLWQMLSSVHGQLLNYEDISRSLGISRATVLKYIDFLESAYLIRRLYPWFINVHKRIVKSPKLYFRDSGLLHYMHHVHSYNQLVNHIIVGASWEGFVIEQIIQHLPPSLHYYFYRTHHGAEADMVIVKGNVPLASIEIKITNTPSIPKGFMISIEDLKTKKNFIITPESDDYVIKNIRICALETFIHKYLNQIK